MTSIVTNEYNAYMTYSNTFESPVITIEKYVGVYDTVKGSFMDDGDHGELEVDCSDIEFYRRNVAKMYYENEPR